MSWNINLLLVAHGVEASQAFEKLTKYFRGELEEKPDTSWPTVNVSSALSFGRVIRVDDLEKTAAAARTADVTLVGMSSVTHVWAVEEFYAAQTAMQHGKKIALYFHDLGVCVIHGLNAACALFVANEEKAENAKGLFPNATIVAANPVWEEFCFAGRSRDEVRSELYMENDKDIDIVILCPGANDPQTTYGLWQAVLTAVQEDVLANYTKLVILAPHADDNGELIENYVELTNAVDAENSAFADIVLSPTHMKKETLASWWRTSSSVSHIVISTLDIIPACDIVVSAGSPLDMAAAHERVSPVDSRKPVINYYTREHYAQTMKEFGVETVWRPEIFGVTEVVREDPVTLAHAIDRLLRPGGYKNMKSRQEIVFPTPAERGAALKKMAQTIIALA